MSEGEGRAWGSCTIQRGWSWTVLLGCVFEGGGHTLRKTLQPPPPPCRERASLRGSGQRARVLDTCIFLCMGTPDLPQRGALSLRAPGLSWVRERGLTADLGAGRLRRGNRLQNAFRPGGGGAGSPEPRSRWVCVCPELVGGGCPRRCYFHPLWLQQRAREVSGGDKRKCRGDGKSPLLAPGRERWRRRPRTPTLNRARPVTFGGAGL